MTIISLGCSFTAQYHPDIKPWPTIIQEKTGEVVINYGTSGSGNRHAFDLLISYIRMGKKVDTVYWLMTEFDRTDIFGLNPYYPNYFFTLRPYSAKDPENFINRWKAASLREPPASEIDRIKAELDLAKIFYENTTTEDYFDSNLKLIVLMQKVCKKYGIKLKIASALRPLYTHDSNEISYILKSKHNKNIDFSTIIGYPFYKEAAGMCVVQIKNWDTDYCISATDNHPGQNGSNFIADLFLGEKNILDYR